MFLTGRRTLSGVPLSSRPRHRVGRARARPARSSHLLSRDVVEEARLDRLRHPAARAAVVLAEDAVADGGDHLVPGVAERARDPDEEVGERRVRQPAALEDAERGGRARVDAGLVDVHDGRDVEREPRLLQPRLADGRADDATSPPGGQIVDHATGGEIGNDDDSIMKREMRGRRAAGTMRLRSKDRATPAE